MSEHVLDEWQIVFSKKKEELENCQVGHRIKSCMKCTKLLDCDVRDAYVKALYDSMSKGAGGGFEF